jgi:hypothetical protein
LSKVDAEVHLVGDLKNEVVESAKREAIETVRKRLEELAQTTRKLSIHEREALRSLSEPQWSPLKWMNKEDYVDFAKKVIRTTSNDLTKAGELQSVGVDTDVVIISSKTGVDPVEYGEDAPRQSNSGSYARKLCMRG